VLRGEREEVLAACAWPLRRDDAGAALLHIAVDAAQFCVATGRTAAACEVIRNGLRLAEQLPREANGDEAAAASQASAMARMTQTLYGLGSCCVVTQLVESSAADDCADAPQARSSARVLAALCLALSGVRVQDAAASGLGSAAQELRFHTWPLSLQVLTHAKTAALRGDASLALAALSADLCRLCAAPGEPSDRGVAWLEHESYISLTLAAADPASPLHAAHLVRPQRHSLPRPASTSRVRNH